MDNIIEKYMVLSSKNIELNENFESNDINKLVKNIVNTAKKMNLPRAAIINSVAHVISNMKNIDLQKATQMASKMIK